MKYHLNTGVLVGVTMILCSVYLTVEQAVADSSSLLLLAACFLGLGMLRRKHRLAKSEAG